MTDDNRIKPKPLTNTDKCLAGGIAASYTFQMSNFLINESSRITLKKKLEEIRTIEKRTYFREKDVGAALLWLCDKIGDIKSNDDHDEAVILACKRLVYHKIVEAFAAIMLGSDKNVSKKK